MDWTPDWTCSWIWASVVLGRGAGEVMLESSDWVMLAMVWDSCWASAVVGVKAVSAKVS